MVYADTDRKVTYKIRAVCHRSYLRNTQITFEVYFV